MRFSIVFLLVCFYSLSAFSQDTGELHGLHSLGPHQKGWLITHPFIAHRAYKLTKRVLVVTAEIKKDTELDGDANGGQVDAFRHSYWMAYLSQHICWRKIRRLGIAHEKDDYSDYKKNKVEDGSPGDSLMSVMDKFNNNGGLQIGKSKNKFSESELKEIIKQEVLKGNMRMMLKDSLGNYLDCERKIIRMEEWKGKWYKPKCLIPSDKKK